MDPVPALELWLREAASEPRGQAGTEIGDWPALACPGVWDRLRSDKER